MRFYKHSDFEQNLRLRVTYNGQAEIDDGWLSRFIETFGKRQAQTGSSLSCLAYTIYNCICTGKIGALYHTSLYKRYVGISQRSILSMYKQFIFLFILSMKNIKEKFLWNFEKSFENCTNSHRIIVWVLQFNTQSIVMFIRWVFSRENSM